MNNTELYLSRLNEFNVLRMQYAQNEAVNQIIQHYASGTICTREEALFHMVIHLCRALSTTNRQFDRQFDQSLYFEIPKKDGKTG